MDEVKRRWRFMVAGKADDGNIQFETYSTGVTATEKEVREFIAESLAQSPGVTLQSLTPLADEGHDGEASDE